MIFSKFYIFLKIPQLYLHLLMKKTHKRGDISQKPAALREGRPCLCCYDFKWSEITAKGDWRSLPLQLWFQMKWNNSKRRPNDGGTHLQEETLLGENRASLLQEPVKMHSQIFQKFSWKKGRPIFPQQGFFLEMGATIIRSPLAVISLHLKS